MFIKLLYVFSGIISSSGKLWLEHRHFSHTVLKDFGMGRPMLEDKIHDGLSLMLAELEKLNLTELDIHHLLILTVANVTHDIVVGKSYEYDDPFFKRLVSIYEESFQIFSSSGVVNFFPKLIYLPGDIFGIQGILKYKEDIQKTYKKMCKEHLESLDQHHDRDFVDAYLKRIQEIEANQEETTLSSINSFLSMTSLCFTIFKNKYLVNCNMSNQPVSVTGWDFFKTSIRI